MIGHMIEQQDKFIAGEGTDLTGVTPYDAGFGKMDVVLSQQLEDGMNVFTDGADTELAGLEPIPLEIFEQLRCDLCHIGIPTQPLQKGREAAKNPFGLSYRGICFDAGNLMFHGLR